MLGAMRSCACRISSMDTVTEKGAGPQRHQYTPGRCFVERETSKNRPRWGRRAGSTLVAGFGWLLSPLSWWNDLVVNVPLAYLFATPFSLLDERFYVPAFALGYWLTNLLGFVLLHKGVVGMVSTRNTRLRTDLFVATAYTFVIVVIAWLGWLPSPASLLEQWHDSAH